MIDRSGGAAVTETESVEELLALLESPAVVTVAMLLTLPDAEMLAATTKGIVVADAPALIGPALVQVTVWPEALQVHPAAVPDTKANCEAKTSVTVIGPVVGPVPAFFTAMLNVPFVPAAKVPV